MEAPPYNSIPEIQISIGANGRASNSIPVTTTITVTGLNTIYKYGKVLSHSPSNGSTYGPNYVLNQQYELKNISYFGVAVISNGSGTMSIAMTSSYYN